MKRVHQHPDGYVIVDNDNVVYMEMFEYVNADFGVEFPSLPEGAIERIYEPGRRHTLQGEGTVIGGDVMPWPLGDQMIEGVAQALLTKRNRDIANQEAAEAKAMEEFTKAQLAKARP